MKPHLLAGLLITAFALLAMACGTAAAAGPELAQRKLTVKAFTADRISTTVRLLIVGSSSSTVITQADEAAVLKNALVTIGALPVADAVLLTDFSLPGADLEVLLLEPVTPPKALELAWQVDFSARAAAERKRQEIEAMQPLLTPVYIEYVRAQTVTTQITE